MAKNELRGASRRQFIQGVTAMGAMLGWGPTRVRDFIARGAGDAAAANTISQSLVVMHGQQGAHGYPHLLWPHPDCFATGRPSSTLSSHFMQTSAGTGAVGSNLNTALSGVIDYTNPPAMPSRGQLGAWSTGERYKKVMGADNQAFAGYTSTDATSMGIDKTNYGSTTVPTNANMPKSQKFLVAGRETPWLDKYGMAKAITSMEGGDINVFHRTGAHNHYINYAKGYSMMAAAAIIHQSTTPTIVPVITIGSGGLNDPDNANFDMYGAPGVNLIAGAPTNSQVSNANGLVNLFNSNCAKALGALNNPANAALFEAYTKGWLGSSKSAQLPTFSRGYRTAKLASNLVGLNLASKLLPTVADQQRYGYTGTVNPKLSDMRDALIVTAKALALGLTKQCIIVYGNDDPHGLFSSLGQDGINAATFAAGFGNCMNAFMDDLMAVQDPFFPQFKLGDNTCIAFVGDVSRTFVNNSNWNDPTFGDQNRCWVMSNGILKNGFFGGDRPRTAGEGAQSNGHNTAGPGEGCMWDKNTGDAIRITGVGTAQGVAGDFRNQYGETAMASVLYAVTRGDDRRVQDFYSGVLPRATFNPVIL